LPVGLLPANTTVTYQKTFVTPAGVEKNLYLTSDGSLTVVEEVAGVQTATLLTSVAPGSYASSVSSFGKELIAFHNNLYGTDTPRIYDGQFLDRATQCGPGAPPTIQSIALPPSDLTSAGGSAVAIVSVTPTDPINIGGTIYYTTITVVTAVAYVFVSGQVVELTGTTEAQYNGFLNTISLIDTVTFKMGYNQTTFTTATGGNASLYGSTLVRTNNLVTATTATPHNLNVGYQAQISGVIPSDIGGGITSIVLNNVENPGIATVTTTTPHGLQPENVIAITGVPDSTVGGAIATVQRSAQIATIQTTAAHGLSLGSVVNVATSANHTFDGQWSVLAIIDNFTFTYAQVEADQANTVDAGTVSYLWPLSQTTGIQTQDLFSVLSTPTDTTFTVSLNYTSGTWTGGTISFAWDGTFFVTNVISSTSFQYRQYGPNISTSSVGTVTPFGQAAPGKHQMVVMFQTRQGLITAPSPATTFIANGGQYLVLNGVPLGPADTIARILAFTGTDGDNFFYIPVPAFISGLTVSTSTVIADNVSTSVTLDFSDNTLFSSIAIDAPGNNLFALGVLGPVLGVDAYASRAAWFGMRNSIQNFLNLGFEGGYLNLNTPLGWTPLDNHGSLVATDTGMAWEITGVGLIANNIGIIRQPAFVDSYNVPILQGNTQYSVQLKLKVPVVGVSGSVGVALFDTGTNTTITFALIPVSSLETHGKFFTVDFPVNTPDVISPTTVFQVYTTFTPAGFKVDIDDIEIYPTLNPFLTTYWWSYINLPDSLDLVTGQFGAASDPTYIQSSFTYRDAFLFLTQFGLYESRDLPNLEPAQWEVRQVSTNCGSCGPRAITTGENFSTWVTSPSTQPPVGRGLYLYTGGAVYKLSQEIQPDFDRVNPNYEQSIWVTNDAINRRIYVGLPLDTAQSPNVIYVLDYREMDTASEIAGKGPIHISFSGKMICSDLSRKWTRWSLAAQCAEIMTVFGQGVYFSIGAGDGLIPGVGGFGNCYWFNPDKYTDDDYGQIVPYYDTYFFINHEAETALQVGVHRKLYNRYAIFISGIGLLTITPYGNSLTNPLPQPPQQLLSTNPTYDMGDGLNVIAERAAFRISAVPVNGTDVNFELNKFIITMRQEPVAPIRFGAV
jgi:hypothetical protein